MRFNLMAAALLCVLAGATRAAGVHAPDRDSGAELYQHHCAACHGQAGAGDGPAAAALRRPPTDLRRLAAANDGRFPQRRVRQALDGRGMPLAHGTREMPVWGRQWRRDGSVANEAEVDAIIVKIGGWLRTIQQ